MARSHNLKPTFCECHLTHLISQLLASEVWQYNRAINKWSPVAPEEPKQNRNLSKSSGEVDAGSLPKSSLKAPWTVAAAAPAGGRRRSPAAAARCSAGRRRRAGRAGRAAWGRGRGCRRRSRGACPGRRTRGGAAPPARPRPGRPGASRPTSGSGCSSSPPGGAASCLAAHVDIGLSSG